MNISGIDLNLLLAFEALLDERHVGRAARHVGLSQPAFSNAIARLRTRLGDPLFVRTAQGMMPTPRADQLAGPIRSALAQLRQTFEAPHSFDPSVSAHRFRIGLSDDVELRLVPLLARSMLSGELQMQTRRLDWLFTVPESELRNGALDLAIGYFPDARQLASGLVMESISEENNVVIARRGHSMWGGYLLKSITHHGQRRGDCGVRTVAYTLLLIPSVHKVLTGCWGFSEAVCRLPASNATARRCRKRLVLLLERSESGQYGTPLR